MFFYFIFGLLLSSQAVFTLHLLQQSSVVSVIIAIVQLLTFVISLIILIRSFRRRVVSNSYKRGFYAFGFVVASAIPALVYLPFGIAYAIAGVSLIREIGWICSVLLFTGILYGIFRGRWAWKIHRLQLAFDHLPAEMDETRIVQISDIHVGSFFNQYSRVQKAIDLINSLDADYVLFTGDLVNNTVEEMKGWEPVFNQIQARKGKYSILGNHDYGDYIRWSDPKLKEENLQSLVEMHRAIGFTPLLNANVQLSNQENGVWLIGVENWGTAPFRQSGDLAGATAGIPENAFKLLLSHDPSHFDEQVMGTGIDLTLSGHTHGMQFGIERFGIKFSPVQFRYKKWAGLYQVGKQYLYVNRGFGYLGFPGRVGIYPEITLIELRSSSMDN